MRLSARYIYGEDPASIWTLPDTSRALDVSAIQQAAARYLNEANRVEITLVPEKQKL